ncbi:hypothetical protein [Bdellovibrio bacteriovorus]|uniref:hypothetical protein n=1 Tax=Bdellovibrio bacteriovorus TaxID=959 RepID=UPI0005A2AAFF|nr:hypothetical protein [Bdellovibrio bacteriovorus]
MKLFPIVLAFISSSAFASNKGYDLKMDLSLNGKLISHTQAIVKAGETTTIAQETDTEEGFIEALVSEGSIQNNKGILMKFVVGVVDKNGKRVNKVKLQVLAKENVPAQITFTTNNGDEASLSVVANRRLL